MVHKGLPFGLDVGVSYIAASGNRILGADLKWTVLPGGAAIPAAAVKLSATQADLFFVQARSYKADVLVSKGLGFLFDPYAGLGLQWINGDINAAGVATGLPPGVSGHHSETAVHLFAGLPVKLGFLKATGEYDYSFLSVSTFSLKVSFAL